MTDLIITNPGGGDIVDANGELIGGSFSPTTGYVGVPLPFVDLVDADGTEVASFDGYVVSEAVLQNPNLIAGLLPFFAVEIEASRPAFALTEAMGWATRPWPALSIIPPSTEETITICASDLGYRTESPVVPYPPLLQRGFSVDARVPLSPGQVGIVWGWGTLSLVNSDRSLDALVRDWNIDGRAITIKYGIKTWDDSRGIFLDPLTSDLVTVFTGVGASWLLNEFTLELPLRDASYWLDRPLQKTLYGGTGTYEGDAELAETPKPMTRGKVFNVPLLLIDRMNLIYQYNDGPGSVVALYEGAATTIAFESDTTDLYTGSTTSGMYRTDNSRGLIQLGLEPADGAAITADVIGHFPVAGSQLVAANIARYLMSEDMDLPAAFLDTASFTTAATDYPYEAGWFWGPNDKTDGATAVGQVLGAFGARMVPAVDGSLQCLVLKAVAVSDTPVAEYTTASIRSCEPRAMPAEISPPAKRIRVAYQHNYTVQLDGVLNSAGATHRQFVQTADRYATWLGSSIATAYANANDIPPFGGGLTTEADAQAVANRMGALFGTRRWLWDMQIPLIEGVSREFGEVVVVEYPNHALANGARCRIVGRSVDTQEEVMTLTVLS